jgi:DnaJ-class molecular chaperone
MSLEEPFVLLRKRAVTKALLLDPKATHYAVLGVSPGACNTASLKDARRQLALMCHPDLHPGDPRAHDYTARANVAYDVLSDAALRRTYDAHLKATHKQCAACGGEGFKTKQRGFKALDRLRCLGCDGEGWVLK